MENNTKPKLIEKKYLLPFILITSLFALWGFANDITNPMVAAFQTLMELPASEAALVQFAFYGGYATMAVPAALFIRKYSYKSAIMLGLALYAVGAFLFIPAANYQMFSFFCVSLYILTFGLAFLETTANPMIMSLGDKKTATRRLNLAQAFNPLGSLSGMAVASLIVLPSLISDKRDAAGEVIFHGLSEAEKANIRMHDLVVIRDPYVAIGLLVVLVLIVIGLTKMPKTKGQGERGPLKDTFARLWKNRPYREGVVAQMFYVAAQIMVWTFIIQYADNLGIDKATAQNYNIVAMVMFLCSRFVTTYLMRYIDSRKLLMIFGVGAVLASLGTILIVGKLGLYCLVAISFFMSLMFPTIYGIALENVEKRDTELGASFLVMAIVGGAIMPPLQGMVIDLGTVAGMPAVNVSYALPMICFIIVAIYAYRSYKLQLTK
ncbi:MAG: L-fucose:H+ symporter permease [Bacteroidaceae bacterium]|nr:L-fucose:H+ symporter permease [Bacteroidaceae bacterium]